MTINSPTTTWTIYTHKMKHILMSINSSVLPYNILYSMTILCAMLFTTHTHTLALNTYNSLILHMCYICVYSRINIVYGCAIQQHLSIMSMNLSVIFNLHVFYEYHRVI